MGVYIRGMEMPMDCFKCTLQGNPVCIEHVDFSIRGKRPEQCPLVEVPTMHGRLIDVDALLLKIDCHGTNKFGILDEDIREFISEVPTIIPAEDGE